MRTMRATGAMRANWATAAIEAMRTLPTLCLFALVPGVRAGEPADLAPLMQPLCEKYAAPAALAAVVKDGRIEGLGVCGVRRLGDGSSATGETAASGRRAASGESAAIGDLSLIGSCGKAVTRLLIARLADQRKMPFESTLETLLPDVKMRDEYRSVTLGQIMKHRAGIQPYTEIGPGLTPVVFSLSGTPREQRAAFVAHLLEEEPAAQPGTREVYSNAGYCLLGHIAERVAGVPFEELVPREVFGPLGMKDSFIGRPVATLGRPHLTGHMRGARGYQAARDREALAVMAPAGMMTCSISDFARLAGRLASVEAGAADAFITPGAAKHVAELTPGSAGEGEPFFGGDGQYTAAFALWPSRKLAIVVESNAGDNDAVCAAILEAIRAKHAPDARPVPQEEGPGAAPKGPRLGLSLRATDPENVLLDSIEPGSAAEKAGLKAGDRLIAIDGVPMSDIPREKLREALAGKRITFKIERDGKPLEITVDRPKE